MNFFKSVFSEDPDDSNPTSESSSENQPQTDPNPGAWSFGGLIKTLATKSESVIETYSKDLQEFGSGLKKEIEVVQGSLGTMGQTIDEFGNSVLKGTAQIISQGKDAILAADLESDSSDPANTYGSYSSSQGRYSRFHAQFSAIQGDFSTYCDDPEDLEDYTKWKSEFVLEERNEDIENLLDGNEAMENIYKKLVPGSVDQETFWCRYFYKVHKLKQAEDVRAKLVKRAIATEDEEELSWDVDESDDDVKEESEDASKTNLVRNREVDSGNLEAPAKDGGISAEKLQRKDTETAREDGEKSANVQEVGYDVTKSKNSEEDKMDDSAGNLIVGESKVDQGKGGNAAVEGGNVGSESHVPEGQAPVKGDSEIKKVESDDKVGSDAKADTVEPHKDSQPSLISSQQQHSEEEDLGWDEIEDLSTLDDKKDTHTVTPNRDELKKRLSTAEEEEDLSWDIEDDDEPAKP